MFSRSLNKVWCVNSLINDVKIELTACGCLQSTIACQPRLPPYKLYPCCLPFVSCPISKLNFCGERRQFKCFCCRWWEELMWNLRGDQSVLEERMTPNGEEELCWPAWLPDLSLLFCHFKEVYCGCRVLYDAFTKDTGVWEVWDYLRYISAQIWLCCVIFNYLTRC